MKLTEEKGGENFSRKGQIEYNKKTLTKKTQAVWLIKDTEKT